MSLKRFFILLVAAFFMFGCQLFSNVTPTPASTPLAKAATSVPTEPVAVDANEEAVAAAVEATIAAMPTQTTMPTNTPAPTETAIPTEVPAEEATTSEAEEATATVTPTETVAPASSCTHTGWRASRFLPGETQYRGFDRNIVDILAPTPIDGSRLQIEKLDTGMWLSLTEHSTFADAGDNYFDVQVQTELQQNCYVTTVWFGQGNLNSVRLWLDGAAIDHFDGWCGDSNSITIGNPDC